MSADQLLDVDRLRKLTDDMIVALTSPAFVEAMRTFKATPVPERLKLGEQILTPDALRAKGVPLPEDMRVTSRYFEAGSPMIEVSGLTTPGSLSSAREIPQGSHGNLAMSPLGGCCCGGAGACGGCGGGAV
ncbi:hypothetical protein [Burkholderia pyrrocinia]|uniref:hypothetical protein n=1 Tax=Burkholderia pyrrocinia TaxID=60550 RepID=UPI00158C39CF|nr:hypothetical protein [Burkholderia pyrrocinia]